MERYSALAQTYDLWMRQDQPIELWIETYGSVLSRSGVKPGAKVADLACGTGGLTIPLAEAGYRVIGADLSEAMLSRARDKAARAGLKDIPWIRQDLAELSLPGPFDAILCACDGVNYLTGDGEIASFLSRARDALAPGGVLAFDVSAPAKLLPMAGQVYAMDTDEGAYIWTNAAEGGGVIRMELTIFLAGPGGLFTRSEEVHRQRAYTVNELKAFLKAAGFASVSVTDFDGSAAQKTTRRFLVTALKKKGKR